MRLVRPSAGGAPVPWEGGPGGQEGRTLGPRCSMVWAHSRVTPDPGTASWEGGAMSRKSRT